MNCWEAWQDREKKTKEKDEAERQAQSNPEVL